MIYRLNLLLNKYIVQIVDKILIIGTGGLATQIIDEVSDIYKDIFFYNNIDNIEYFFNFRVIHDLDNFNFKNFILAISKLKLRKSLDKEMRSKNIFPVSFISSKSYISNKSKISPNVLILSNSLVEPMSIIGYGTFLNVGVNFHHDSECGSFCEFGPRSVILGNVTIGNETFIGSGAILRENINIGNNSIIGCGSVVVKDIPDNEIWVGNPAKFLRKNLIQK